MDKLYNIHPGEILKEEFLAQYGITAYRLAKETKLPLTRVTAILKKRRKITTDTALRLSAFFGNSVEFWIGIQNEFDIREAREKLSEEICTINRFAHQTTT